MHYPLRTLTLALLILHSLGNAGCALDANATDDELGTSSSALIAACATGTWCIEPPPVTTAPLLHGVWAVSASDVFAVGDAGTILRRSPTAWTAMSSGTTNKLLGVWAASSSDVWAVGTVGTILHFNGTAWSAVTGVTTSDLDAVWGSSSTDVWFDATGTVLHWNGSTFSTSASFSGHLLSVSGTGPSDVWTTGENSMVHHFTGTWLPAINPGVGTNTFFAVLAVAAGDAWVTDFMPTKETVHLSAGHWIAQKASGTFNGLSAFGASDIWGAGTSTKIGHWDGTAWTTTQPLGSLGSIWSVTTAPGHVWVVGDSGLIAHRPL